MNKIIAAIFFVLFVTALQAQNRDAQRSLQADISQLLLAWTDEDRDREMETAIQMADERSSNKRASFFKIWAAAHAEKASYPLAHYFDQNKNLKIKENLRDRFVLRKLKRALRKQLKQEVKDLKAFTQEKDLNANVRYKASNYQLEIQLPQRKQAELDKALNSALKLEIYPLYTAFELLGDGQPKGLLARLDSLWQASGDPSEALPKLEQSILEIGELGYVQTKKDPFTLLLNEKDTQRVFNYLRGFLTHSLLPDAVFMANTDPQQKDETTDAYYKILVLKKNGNQMILDAQNLNQIYIKKEEWGKSLGFEMDKNAAEDWAKLSGDAVGQSLAIVLEGKIYSYPKVMEIITAGKVEISGDFEGPELEALKNKITPKALPLHWKIIRKDE